MIHRFQLVAVLAWLTCSALLLSGCSPSRSEERGQELFDLHCAMCHQGPTPDLKKQPPKLEGLFQSKTLPSGAPSTDEQLRRTIIEGRGTMPAFDQRLQNKDVDDLVKYMHTLK